MKKWENSFFYEARGERSFFEIAEEFGIGEMILRAANPGVRQIQRGTELEIPVAACPNGVFHVLKEGEGIFEMAVGSRTPAENILAANPGFSPRLAVTGQTVILPEKERETRYYQVQAADHLWDILRRFEMSVPLLRKLNPGVDIFSLKEGQKILVAEYLPASGADGIYTLKPGETLFSVCERIQAAPADLLRANPNLRPQDFTGGTRILLPGRGKPS